MKPDDQQSASKFIPVRQGFPFSSAASYNTNMVAFRGHFDGRVIIPEGHISLPCDRELLFQVEPEGIRLAKATGLLAFAGTLDEQTAREMEEALKDCERIDNEW